jgi:DNA polymerase-3 subunit epsilon
VTYDQTHWIPVQQRRPLPTFYYHEHFVELLDFVAKHYAHALLDPHLAFIRDFARLPKPAQCLYVRLANRKGRVFAVNRLRYPELGDHKPLLNLLREQDWIGTPDVSDFGDVLGFLTKDEIYEILLPRFVGLSRSLKKAELTAFARESADPAEFMRELQTERLLVQKRDDEIRYLLFLYFGRIQEGLSRFTMRDLGLVRAHESIDGYEPRFADRAEALENYYFATRLRAAEQVDASSLQEFAAELTFWPETNFSSSAALRDRLALCLGRAAEKTKVPELALACYEKGESAQCSERLIRLLLANGRREQAKEYLERCIDEPRSDEECLFAKDLYERKFKKKRTSALTDVLRQGDFIDIDESRNGSPERAVAEYFEQRGITAYRTENLLWRTLFGLLFWDELFVDDDAALHSPFEFLPASLVNNTFYKENRAGIDNKLAILNEPESAKHALLKVSTRNYGTPNGVFRWRQTMNEALFALLDNAPACSIAAVVEKMCKDYNSARYGYPDLMLIENPKIRFIEVKTEGDQLRRNQLLRLEQLRAAGFEADVVRVRWVIDPDQTYVVVDVETTGGQGENHRVTEIGAVKVRNGIIVDRFQTLLNPQRTIPSEITRLTGITPAMVADAPYFSDIADRFEAFLKDSIFVAHNVEFDYGFLAREFRRIGRSFRYPRLCTCASMRKLFPGHRSYSLASLCDAYSLPLKQHHRALCDAEAAAELLIMINEKRQLSAARPDA